MNYIIYPEIFGKNVKAFFTGKSPGADIEKIAELGDIKKDNIYFPKQEHTGRVVKIGSRLEPETADAVITQRNDILLAVQVADCVPILLYAEKTNTIGAIHAGWRGTSKGILKRSLKTILKSSNPDDILIAIGPSIRWCCYSVGDDVIQTVIKETGKGDYHLLCDSISYLDLPYANQYQAMSMGIPKENIWMSGECTYCSPERFYSYRYLKGKLNQARVGRQGGFIRILS